MHIAIVGPVSAHGLAGYFAEDDASVASEIAGSYGTSPTAIARALLDAGHRVTVVTHRRGHAALSLDGDRLTFRQVDSRRSAAAQALDWWRPERAAMRCEIGRAQPDVVHAHWTYEWALSALESHRPTLITIRDAPLTILRYMPNAYRVSRLFLAWRVRISGRRASMTAISPYVGARWRTEMLWRRDIVVIPNMVENPHAAVPEKFEVPTIIEVASDDPHKNVRRLLQAFQLVRRQIPNAELILLGPGLGPRDTLAQSAKARGVVGGVKFYGPTGRETMSTLLASSWVHVHASLEESFGNTLVEAMVAGTAVIGGRDSAAVPWVLDEGRAGRLTNVRDAWAMAQDIVALLSDAAERNLLVEVGHRRAVDTFSDRRVIADYVRAYEGAIVTHERRR